MPTLKSLGDDRAPQSDLHILPGTGASELGEGCERHRALWPWCLLSSFKTLASRPRPLQNPAYKTNTSGSSFPVMLLCKLGYRLMLKTWCSL